LDDGTLFAYEALVRCPTFSPASLFSRAAALQSAGRLGRMIREIAVSFCHGTPLFVNLHASEEAGWLLREDDPIFSHDDDIYLEVAESVPATHADLCDRVFEQVRGRTGIYLGIDNFGADDSDLHLIIDFRPNVVKLHRRFAHELHRDPRRQKSLAGMVRLCSDLGADVMAEGIETKVVGARGARAADGLHFAHLPGQACHGVGGYVSRILRRRPPAGSPTHALPSSSAVTC
jgi:EAL domain-containing protein (putative c-di-GMP-specific phosphodiesterase class I)